MTDSVENLSHSEDNEVCCPETHEHTGWCVLDQEFNFSVDQIFDMLFSNCAFFCNFLETQKTTDINLGTWSEEVDDEGRRHRHNTFTIAVNASFGPKSTPASENQHMSKDSKPGSYYCIDADQVNDPSLPYGENFYVWNRYCISKLSKRRSRLLVHAKIVYKKSVFSLVKALIEKTVKNGVFSYYKPLGEVLAAESNKVVGSHEPMKKKRYTRHRTSSNHRVGTKPSNSSISSNSIPTQSHKSTELDFTRKNAHITSTVRVMSALLIFLVVFNILLFCKLWALENTQNAELIHGEKPLYYSPQDLVELLNKQKSLYEKDFKHWQATLETSAAMIEELKHSLEEMRKSQKQKSENSYERAQEQAKVDL